MTDRQDAQKRLTTLLQEDADAIPYLIGYLTWRLEPEEILRAVDSYLEHDEQITAIRAAMKVAEDHARLHPQM